jgi:hypothetical protein
MLRRRFANFSPIQAREHSTSSGSASYRVKHVAILGTAGCRQVKQVDFRTLDRHPESKLEALIPSLSCRDCSHSCWVSLSKNGKPKPAGTHPAAPMTTRVPSSEGEAPGENTRVLAGAL